MTETQWHLLLEVLKAATPFVLSFVVYYVKQLNSSIKTMEHDINEIKIGLSSNGNNLNNIKERVATVEQEQREQMKAWVCFWQNHGSNIERLKNQQN